MANRTSAYNPPKGPGKGVGNASPKAAPWTAEQAKEMAEKSGYVRRARAEARRKAVAENRAEYLEPTPSRAEIADLAKTALPAALERLETLIHESRSDMAVVQAFNALKETAFGKDTQPIEIKFEFEGMTEAELREAIMAELGTITIEHDPESGGPTCGVAQA